MANSPISVDEIFQLLSSDACSNMSSEEDVLQYIKDNMARQTILKQYGYMIKQLPDTKKNGVVKPGRFYIRLKGQLVYKTNRKDIEDVLITHYQSEATPTRTLTTVYEEWLDLRKHDVAATTYDKDKKLWKNFFKDSAIASMPLTDLDRVILKKWAYDIIERNSMTKKYFYNVASLLNHLLDYAVDKSYISMNPYRGTKLNKHAYAPPTPKKEFDEVFTKEEQKAVMLEAEKASIDLHSALPLGICVLFLTGLRSGELCALKYKDIVGNTLHVQRMQVVNITDDADDTDENSGQETYKIESHTKSDAGNRFIPLTKQCMEYLERIKKINQELGYDTSPDDYIFMRSKDKLANSRAFDDRLRRYCRKAKMSVIKSQHDIRRTYITCLIDNGVNIEKVRRIAGHATIEMTMKYVRNRDMDVTDILEKALEL